MLGCCGCGLVSWLLITGLVVLLGFYLSKKDHPKIAGVYSQPGKWFWLKVAVFYVIIKFRNWKDARDKAKQSRDHTKLETYNSGYGTKSKSTPQEMEKVQPLSSHFQAIDAIYFNGANAQGVSLVTGTARRPHGVVNGFLILRIPELGYLVSPKLPDVQLFGGTEECFGAEGFSYKPIKPMKHWALEYKGDLKFAKDPSKKVKVHFKADWKTELDYFDYDTMIPPLTMARAFAAEKWSREYFETLKTAHQTHYEQHGTLKGEIEIEGKKYPINLPSMRDHSYGIKRNWKLLHRYNIHMFSLEDGRRFNVGVVSQPCTCSSLEIGYMYDHDGTLYPLERVDHPLHLQGELGDPPKDYGITVKATNGKTYYIQVKVLETTELHIGWEWEARIIERRCNFVVDGIQGWGISECMYRHTGGRPEEYKKSDPDWVKDVKTVE